jgi:FtsP/CotA-like multicopper oxidase with cupredoxin domain
MSAVKVNESSELYAYKMISHKVTDLNTHAVTDVTSTHSLQPSVPGPTIVIKEGDEVFLTIQNGLNDPSLGIVGVHVHGIHYDILSDGTLKELNGVADEGAPPPYIVHWIAGPGTKGTWPYHDHTLMGVNGKEYRGLFGAVIINPADGNLKQYKNGNVVNVALSSITKEIVAYARDDSFWIQEIDNSNGHQTPLGTNPDLKAITGSNVRWHVIPLGTDIHDFSLKKYMWLDPGTNNGIEKKMLGPLENHAFVVTVKNEPAKYKDSAFKNLFLGDEGKFDGVANGPAVSTPTNPVLANLTERT